MLVEEMRYLECGISHTIYLARAYLKKSKCNSVAAKHVGYQGMSKARIAHEIYAHAVLFYASTSKVSKIAAVLSALSGFGTYAVVNEALHYIRRHANPVNLGSDKAYRVAIYNAIWKIF